MHMKNLKYTFFFILSVVFLPHYSFADTSLNFSGNVVASPCVLVNDDMYVDLGTDIQTKDLKVAGSATEWVPFIVALTSCPVGTIISTITFNGNPDAIQPDMYENYGTATNVAVELESNAGVTLGNNTTLQENVAPDRTVNYNLQARIYAVANNVNAGTVSAIVDITLTYQ